MFNLDVAELDNYYVGEYGWLVHNCNVAYQSFGGLKRDVLTKGFHVNSDIGELSLLPRRLANGTIEIMVAPAGGRTGKVTNKVVKGVDELLTGNPDRGIAWANGMITGYGDKPGFHERIAEAQLIIEALTNGNYLLTK